MSVLALAVLVGAYPVFQDSIVPLSKKLANAVFILTIFLLLDHYDIEGGRFMFCFIAVFTNWIIMKNYVNLAVDLMVDWIEEVIKAAYQKMISAVKSWRTQTKDNDDDINKHE